METAARRFVVDIFLDMLHLFCDASVKVFASAAYIRIEEENNNARCHLLMAKSRVAHVTTTSGTTRCSNGSKDERNLNHGARSEFPGHLLLDRFYVPFQCINNEDKRLKVFVGNRIKSDCIQSRRNVDSFQEI